MTIHPPHENMKIRLVSQRRDLPQVADLIENSFSGHLDTDGKNYIQQIRQAAQNPHLRLWYPGAGEWVSSPVFGYVCEIEGKVVGNLSLIPFHIKNEWIYLIANVAVHPAYRNRGIARRLTQQAIEHVKKYPVSAVWLQVRADNDVAIHLYRSLGFEDRALRTNWLYDNRTTILNTEALPDNVRIQPRERSHWAFQKEWLNKRYPPEIAWYLSFSESRLSPSFVQRISQVVTGTRIQQWSASRENELIGILTWQPTGFHADTLWLAVCDEYQNLAIRCLLSKALPELKSDKPLMINYPAKQAEDVFQDMGFSIHNTLIWMKIKLF